MKKEDVGELKPIRDVLTEVHAGETLVFNGVEVRIVDKVFTKEKYYMTLSYKDSEIRINPNDFSFFVMEKTGKLLIKKN